MIDITLGEPRSHAGLTLFPLFHADGAVEPGDGSTAWTLLADAIADGVLEVREVGDGVVGELVAINRGPGPVLILDGEQLIGAKQNRTTGRTILLDAKSETRIPVSCMEHGRWAHRTRSMAYGGHHSPSSVRVHARRVEAEAARAQPDASRRHDEAAAMSSEPRSRARASSPSSLLSMAQGEVWDSIRVSSERAGVRSPTGALDEVYESRQKGLDERAARFALVPGQIGVLAFVNGAPVGLDLLPGCGIYARVHDRLVRAYLFQSFDARGRAPGGPDGREEGAMSDQAVQVDAEAFLAATLEAERRPLETVGLGRYASLAATDVVGAELAVDGEVVHTSAFNVAR